jgi:hypothetical protein
MWVEKTFTLNPAARPYLPLGCFANIIRLDGLNTGIAISADGAALNCSWLSSWANTTPWASTVLR